MMANYGSGFQAILVVTLLCKALGEVLVINTETNKTVKRFLDFELSFAAEVPPQGIEGLVVVAEPDVACSPIKLPPEQPYVNWFVLIKRRGGCVLEEKIRNAQHAMFQGAIIYNVGVPPSVEKQEPKPISYQDADIEIPAVLIDEEDGLKIASNYLYNQSFKVIIKQVTNFSYKDLVLPCLIVIAACALIFTLFMIVKCIKDRRRNRRNRLSSRHLKHLPIIKFKKGVYDKYEVCAICLDEFVDGEKLRILPCNHAYHTKCIDPWLTNSRRNCPICKSKISIKGVTPESDSESDSEVNNEQSETTPLLLSRSSPSNSALGENTTYGGMGNSHDNREENSPVENEEARSSYAGPTEATRSQGQTTFQAILHNITKAGRRLNGARNSNNNRELLDNASSSSSSHSSYGSVSSLIPPSDTHSINFVETTEEERGARRVNSVVEIASVVSEQTGGPLPRLGRNELVI